MTFHVCDNLETRGSTGTCLYTDATLGRLPNQAMPRCIRHGALFVSTVVAATRAEARMRLGLDKPRRMKEFRW